MTETGENRDSTLHRGKLSLLQLVIPGVAHEINNKNQTILLTTQIILEIWEGLKKITDRYFAEHGDFTAGGLEYSLIRREFSEYCTNVLDSAKSIEGIVSEIRSFAKPATESGFHPVNLNRLIEGAVILLANPIHKATEHLNLELDRAVPEFPGNPEHLVQLLLHLILNACQSLSIKKRGLSILTRHEGSTVACEIRDQGRGIPADAVSRICGYLCGDKPFPGELLGGLETIRSIVLEHAGRLELESEEGRGTRVVLRFPVRSVRS